MTLKGRLRGEGRISICFDSSKGVELPSSSVSVGGRPVGIRVRDRCNGGSFFIPCRGCFRGIRRSSGLEKVRSCVLRVFPLRTSSLGEV